MTPWILVILFWIGYFFINAVRIEQGKEEWTWHYSEDAYGYTTLDKPFFSIFLAPISLLVLFLVLLISGIRLLFAGCSDISPNNISRTLPAKSRFTMTDYSQIYFYNQFYVVKDNKTEKEYLVVRAPEAVAVIQLEK